MKKNFFYIFLNVFMNFCINAEKIDESLKISSSKMSQFQQDFLKQFPFFDFKEEDVFIIISYFRVTLRKNGFEKALDSLNDLQIKYSHELEIVRLIFFYKYILCYLFFDIKQYSQINQQYARIASINFKHAQNIEKIMFLVRNQYFSNESEYNISIKYSDHEALKKRNIRDPYLDSLFELMKISKEYLSLKVLNESLNSRYGESWIESLWYCAEGIKNKQNFYDIDIFYYILIEFLFNQDLIDKAVILYEEMKGRFPDSDFTKLACELFDKKS